MNDDRLFRFRRLLIVSLVLFIGLITAAFFGMASGSTGVGVKDLWKLLSGGILDDPMFESIVWQIRFPRVLVAALAGATLSLGGLVFQAILRNPLAEPYILGISGGSAIGAIIGILIGLPQFPGVGMTAFAGSLITLLLVLIMSSGQTALKKDALLLSGVMVNAFCSAIIMFLLSLTQDSRLHNILFWLMGDLSLSDMTQVGLMASMLMPCFIILFCLSHGMNLLMLGREMAQSLGVNIRSLTVVLLVVTSFMVSATVSWCGPLGFVGLVMPHLLRLILGPDHRIMVPSCILAGGTYMILCDLLARTIPRHGEMPPGVVTAMIGAPLFIYLLRRSSK